MVEEVLELLRCRSLAGNGPEAKPDAVFLDGTLGTGGHTLAMLQAHPTCRVVALDRDAESMAIARRRLEEAGVAARVTFIQGDFRDAASLLQPYIENLKVGADGRSIGRLDGALIDAGMSLYQVTWAERGLSFRGEAELDMRYDRTAGVSAFDLVNRLSPTDLEDLFFKYADERWARRIALTITANRHRTIHTTAELVGLIEAAIPASVRRKSRVHPATKVFAALRLAVNDEYWALDQGAWGLSAVLAIAARLTVLTYSSNEDRTIKRTFRSLAGRPYDREIVRATRKKKPGELSRTQDFATTRSSLTFSLTLPYEGEVIGKGREAESVSPYLQGYGTQWKMRIVTPKPLVPTPEEVRQNPLARSCKLRAVEKVVLSSLSQK